MNVVVTEVAFYWLVNFIGTCSVLCIAEVAFYLLVELLVHVASELLLKWCFIGSLNYWYR